MSSDEQRRAFRSSEGDRYFERNASALEELQRHPENDPVLVEIASLGLTAGHVLEIGASNGWRLEALRGSLQGAKCIGIDPSSAAVADGAARFPDVELRAGTADVLPFEDDAFDLIIFGFCLYLCDRSDLFRIAAEADRVLRREGTIVVYDFHPPFPYRNSYAHHEGIHAYKMDHSTMFTWHPAYREVSVRVVGENGRPDVDADDRVSVVVLRKDGVQLTDPWHSAPDDQNHGGRDGG